MNHSEFYQPFPEPGKSTINPNVDRPVQIPQSMMEKIYLAFEDEINQAVKLLIEQNEGRRDDVTIFESIPRFEHFGTDESKWASAEFVNRNKRGIDPKAIGTKDIGMWQVNERWVNRNGTNFAVNSSGEVDQVYVEIQKIAKEMYPYWDKFTDKQRQESLKDKVLNKKIAQIIFDARGLDQWSVAEKMKEDPSLNFANIELDVEQHQKDIKERWLKGDKPGGAYFRYKPISYRRSYNEEMRREELKKPESLQAPFASNEPDLEAFYMASVQGPVSTQSRVPKFIDKTGLLNTVGVDTMNFDPKWFYDQTFIDKGFFTSSVKRVNPYYDKNIDGIIDEDAYRLRLASTLVHEFAHGHPGSPKMLEELKQGKTTYLGHNKAGLSQNAYRAVMFSILGDKDYQLDEEQKRVLDDFANFYYDMEGIDEKGQAIFQSKSLMQSLFDTFGEWFE